MLQEKFTLYCFGKSEATVCTSIVFPSIYKPTEVPLSELQAKGLAIRSFKGSNSLCCYSDNKIAILQRNKDDLPLFVLQVRKSKSAKAFSPSDQMLLMIITSIIQQSLIKFLVLQTQSAKSLDM